MLFRISKNLVSKKLHSVRETYQAARKTRSWWPRERRPLTPIPRILPVTMARPWSSFCFPLEDCTSPRADTLSLNLKGTPPQSLPPVYRRRTPRRGRPCSSQTWVPPRWKDDADAPPPEVPSAPASLLPYPHGYRPHRTNCSPSRSKSPVKPCLPKRASAPGAAVTEVRAAPIRRNVMELSSRMWEYVDVSRWHGSTLTNQRGPKCLRGSRWCIQKQSEIGNVLFVFEEKRKKSNIIIAVIITFIIIYQQAML